MISKLVFSLINLKHSKTPQPVLVGGVLYNWKKSFQIRLTETNVLYIVVDEMPAEVINGLNVSINLLNAGHIQVNVNGGDLTIKDSVVNTVSANSCKNIEISDTSITNVTSNSCSILNKDCSIGRIVSNGSKITNKF